MYMSSRMPITSAMKEIMFAVSRTVSPWAIWLLPSSRSCTSRPSRLHAEAKEKRVRVLLSRKSDTPRPESKMRAEMLCSRRWRSASATVNTASSSSRVFSQVRKKSPSYMLEKSSFSSASVNCFTLLLLLMSDAPLFDACLDAGHWAPSAPPARNWHTSSPPRPR